MSKLVGEADQPVLTRTLSECLELFNRKERYWLIRDVLGEPASDVPLSQSFRQRLGEIIQFSIPCGAWWAMDYHIDWLFAALVVEHTGPTSGAPVSNTLPSRMTDTAPQGVIKGTQEDFDLIVAFDRTVILIEAKGVTSWGNKQFLSKHRRLADWDQLSERVAPDRRGRKPIEMFMILS